MENNQEKCADARETHTVELLKECSTGCQMAQKSVKQVRSFVTDEKLSELMEAYGEKHSGLEREVASMLGSYGSREEDLPKMAEIGAWMSVEMGMMMHPNNQEAAKKMMDGCNMGIQSVSEYVNRYPDAEEKAHELAKRIIKVEEDFMEEMKAFV